MDILELFIFLVGGCLCGTILIVAYLDFIIKLNHKKDKDSIEEEKQ